MGSDGRREALTGFVRADLNCKMTAELWEAKERRVGTVGTVDYAILVSGHMLVSDPYGRSTSIRTHSPGMDRLVQGIRDGTLEVPGGDRTSLISGPRNGESKDS